MPQIKPSNLDNVHNTNLDKQQLALIQAPTFVASISRLINLGNYENLSLAASVSLPMPAAQGDLDIEVLRQVVKDTASEAFTMVAQEVTKRTDDVKALRNADRGRPTTPE